ncbi:restriction endonuclease subunit S [Bradyrhizobium sp. BR 10289]|uniref:restriction endonuclease subunit S n=1 Tax=Bradyrhizobium sp. BR 10289 TaxID=2749993 RepID=UPI001C653145|nr:restriction endonuclease subunit S [Bradyrhizobium sp. BR 10289]MBW7974856.1 restriction endonuclease subunit S [Bradyrhizobium sp. BR 10289]
MSEAIVTGHWNIPWLRDLPANWQVVSSKRLFAARKELARPDDQQLAATQAYGVISQKEFERRVGRRVVQITQNLEKRRRVEKNDFVISMRSFEGGLERAWETGCIRSSYVVLKPSVEVDVGFFQYLFKSHDYIQALRATSNFIRDGQDLNISNFSLVDLPLPPLDVQGQIARFLDWHGAQTAKLIRAKKKIIALLNEQKQAIIHHVVTCGLDPNVKLKPSGIPWLGDVPAGWEVKKLKYLVRFNNGLAFKPSDWSVSGTPIIRIQNLNGSDVFNYTTKNDLPEDMLIAKGDIVFSWSGNIGTSFGPFIWERDFVGYLNQHIFKLEKVTSHRRYFYYVLKAVTKHVEENAHGIIGLVHITKPELGSISVPLAPFDEQVEIATWLDEHLSGINAIIERARREISLIQEFRTRLTADVVTGKLDVRTFAASLPEVIAAEPIDAVAEEDDILESEPDAEDEAA